jgi:1-acyl-sn-glycerol-3-phosphate acyltransferase
VLIGAVLAILLLRNTMPTQGFNSRLAQSYHRLLLSIIGVKLTVFGEKQSGNVLFVPNHVSWLDISIIGSLSPTHFLSKAEIKNWPLIGLIATRAGTLYIKRGIRNSADDANATLQKTLEKNHNVVLFAEGTTTDGTLRKFHGRLMQSAIDAKSQVQPVAIFYPATEDNNTKIKIQSDVKEKREINKNILYIDKMTFLQSMFSVLSLKNIPVEAHYLEPITTEEQTRNDLAVHCYDRIFSALNAD